MTFELPGWDRDGLFLFDKAVSQLLGPAGETLENSVLVSSLVVVLALFDKLGAVAQHVVDVAGQFVGCGGNRFGHA